MIVAAILILGGVLWRFTPLAQLITPQRLSSWLASIRDQPWTPFAIVLLFVAGGLIAFPVTVLVGATAIVLDPLLAFTVSLAGAMASAILTYAIGAHFVRGSAHTAFGPTLERLNAALVTQGIIAIAIVRNIPIAPFTIVNIAAGCIGVRLRDYILGTALGLAPGLIAITAFGQQLRSVIDHPTIATVGILIAIIAGWITLSLMLQKFLARRQPGAGAR